jgi:hypothetical protein
MLKIFENICGNPTLVSLIKYGFLVNTSLASLIKYGIGVNASLASLKKIVFT